MQSLQRQAAKRLPLIPGRSGSRPRTGTQNGSISQQAGDLFWRCGVECFKPVFTRIDRRYDMVERMNNPAVKRKHQETIEEAKKILQEHRNQIFELVLPLFGVRLRKKDEPGTEADTHAHDYFVMNLFPVMVDMLCAQLPSFVPPDEVEAVEIVVRNIADVQKQRLADQLLNFKFEFRQVVAPKRRG